MNKNYFYTIFNSRRYLSIFHSVTMHRISFAVTAASRQSKQACSALDFLQCCALTQSWNLLVHNQKSLVNQFLEVTICFLPKSIHTSYVYVHLMKKKGYSWIGIEKQENVILNEKSTRFWLEIPKNGNEKNENNNGQEKHIILAYKELHTFSFLVFSFLILTEKQPTSWATWANQNTRFWFAHARSALSSPTNGR